MDELMKTQEEILEWQSDQYELIDKMKKEKHPKELIKAEQLKLK